jgi:hypothetical protein
VKKHPDIGGTLDTEHREVRECSTDFETTEDDIRAVETDEGIGLAPSTPASRMKDLAGILELLSMMAESENRHAELAIVDRHADGSVTSIGSWEIEPFLEDLTALLRER